MEENRRLRHVLVQTRRRMRDIITQLRRLLNSALQRRARQRKQASVEFPAAHQVPPELFATIIREFMVETGDKVPISTFSRSKRELKHHLGQVSLVCRYWAQHSRAAIFEELELRSAADAHQLLTFSRTTTLGMSIGTYIRELTLVLVLPSDPWFHLVVTNIPRSAFAHLVRYTYSFTSGPQATHAPRSVFVGLPRALPLPRLPVRPRLKWLDFAAFGDAVAFVDSLLAPRPSGAPVGDVSTLSLYFVNWTDAPELLPSEVPRAFRGTRRRWRKRIVDVHAVGCSAAWPLMWLLVTAERPRGTANDAPVFVDAGEMCRMATLVRDVVEECKCAMCRVEVSTRDVLLRALAVEHGSCALEAHSRYTHKLVFRLSLDGRVIGIQLNLAKNARALPRGAPPDALSFNWAALEVLLDAFPATLERVCVQVPDTVYGSYEPYVRMQMPRTTARGRLEVEKRATTARERWPEDAV